MCFQAIRAYLLFIITNIILLFPSYSQTSNDSIPKTYILEIHCFNNPDFIKKSNYKKTTLSELECDKKLQNILLNCYDNAYLTAAYDSIIIDSSEIKAFLNTGIEYKWANLKNGNIDEGVLSEIGFREKLYNNKPVYFKTVKQIQEKLIIYFENNGYPFAVIKLDSIDISNGTLSAQLQLTKNSEEKIDSIVVRGSAKITPVYLHNYLGIKPGDLYNESVLKKINTRLAELPFLTNTKPANIIFTNKFNKLILNLDKKQASQFNGIIGVLPDNKTGKILFTGDVQLKLQNGLGKGELIDLNWRKLQTQTQDLKLRLVYPFVFRSPFGVDYNFKLYKRDTIFLDVNQNIGLQYLVKGGNYFKLFYSNKTSSLLSTTGLEYLTSLPINGDVQNNMYGLGLKYEQLDYRLNPRKGFSVLSNASIGTKSIKKNLKLNPVIYEHLKLNTTQYTADFEGSLFIPAITRSTIKIGVQSAFIYGENIFQNELFRIGGLKTLRGFNEESIYASAYSIFTLEYRYILEQNSFLYAFADGAYYENRNVQTFVHDTPYGFGAGISFETRYFFYQLCTRQTIQQSN
jgi:hemolysin activation/secretion protein